LCVAKGTGVVLEHLDAYKKSIMSKQKWLVTKNSGNY
jgi:hypothetical protein